MRIGIQLFVLLVLVGQINSFYSGDYIPAARRGQFKQQRTQWHDLLGRHCPRFGQEQMVLVPLPQPKGFHVEEYKLQLSFDHDRYFTTWLAIMGKGAPLLPMITITFVATSTNINRVHASVGEAPAHIVDRHQELMKEFVNVTHWPKHILVKHLWAHKEEVNTEAGLIVMFLSCLGVFGIVSLSLLRGYSSKIAQFIGDVVGEQDTTETQKSD